MQQRRNILFLSAIAIIFTVAAVVVYLIGQSVPTDDPQPLTTDNTSDNAESLLSFPELRGTRLDFETVRVPTDMENGPKLILVSYDADQQTMINDWFEPLLELNADFPDLTGYYTPLLPKDAADSATFIIGGMALQANEDERARTIVVFTDVDVFNDLTTVETTDTVQLFLLNTEHQIIWRESGEITDDKLAALRSAIDNLLTSQPTTAP